MLNSLRAYSVHLVWGAVAFFFILGLLTLHPIYANICEKDAHSGAENCTSYHILLYAIIWIGQASHYYHGLLTAFATAFIAWFTWTLRRSTDKLYLAGEEQRKSNEILADKQLRQAKLQFLTQASQTRSALAIARISADAATLSAKAAIGIELPVLGLDSPELGHLEKPIPEGVGYAVITLKEFPGRYSIIPWMKIHNAGRTPAFLKELAVGWEISSEQPKSPAFKRTYPYSAGEMVKERGDYDAELHFQIDLTESEIATIKAKESFLWCCVCVKHLDFLRNQHDATFFWRWNNPGGGMYFFEAGGTPYTQFTPAS